MEYNLNPIARALGKQPAEFTKADLIHYIVSNDIHALNFRYTAADGRLKELNFVLQDVDYLDEVLSSGERVDGSSLFPGFMEAGSSDLYVVPIFSSAFLDPFADEPTISFFCAYMDKDGQPLSIAPDQILRRAAQAFREVTGGLEFHAMGELEYYVISPKEENYAAVDQRGYHEMSPFSKQIEFRTQAIRLIAECGGHIKYAHGEVGNFSTDEYNYEQNEIEFLPVPVEQAAQHLQLGKWILFELGWRMGLKVTFAPSDGRIYGAQIVGYDGVDTRIDQYALALKRGMTVAELTELEQAYAPPFSSAKDPVAISAYVAENIRSGRMQPLYWRELREADLSQVALIDVRTPEEYALGTIPGAVNVPLDELRERLEELPRDRALWLFCGVGLRGYLASNILRGQGYSEVRNLVGGIKTYRAATAVIQRPSDPHAGVACAKAAAEQPATETQPEPDAAPELRVLDACGLQCPGPILQLRRAMDELPVGARLEVRATDVGFPRDAEAWCRSTGHRFVGSRSEGGVYIVQLEKASVCAQEASRPASAGQRNKTFILFDDDLDKALATFVLANGAAATGGQVSIFFTFWGLNVLKREHKPRVAKDFFGRMFGWMLPSDSTKLPLSKMNFLGLGPRMMRYLMKQKGVDSVETLRQQALAAGVEFIACQMSMDVMGIRREELLDEVTVGGVASYMERAEQAGENLFI